MWRYSFQERGCLIPLTEFAEAEGEKGSQQDPGLVLATRRPGAGGGWPLARHARVGPPILWS